MQRIFRAMQRYGLIVADNGSDMYVSGDDGRAVGQRRAQPRVPRPDRRRLRSRAARLEGQPAAAAGDTSASSADARISRLRVSDGRRRRMVAEQIRARGVRDPRVLDAMDAVPRERFIPEAARGEAYEDRPVPIGFGQTISQPYIVGYMTEALQLEPSHRVLEIGTGCGYQTAVLAELAARGLFDRADRRARGARAARRSTASATPTSHIRAGDGHAGWPEHAPFDRILGAAAAERGAAGARRAARRRRHPGAFRSASLAAGARACCRSTSGPRSSSARRRCPVRFVPMVIRRERRREQHARPGSAVRKALRRPAASGPGPSSPR